jgi:hypothetical protein
MFDDLSLITREGVLLVSRFNCRSSKWAKRLFRKEMQRINASKNLRGIRFTGHSDTRVLTRCPDLIGRRRTIFQCLKRVSLQDCSGNRKKGTIFIENRSYTLLLEQKRSGVAIVVSAW